MLKWCVVCNKCKGLGWHGPILLYYSGDWAMCSIYRHYSIFNNYNNLEEPMWAPKAKKKSWIWFWSWNYPHKGLIPSIRYSPNCITTIHSSLFGHVYAKMNLHMIFMSVPTNHGITCGILWQDMINLHLILPTHRISKSCLLTRCTHVLHYLLQLHTLWCLINSKINNYVQSKLSMWAWHSKPEHEQEE